LGISDSAETDTYFSGQRFLGDRLMDDVPRTSDRGIESAEEVSSDDDAYCANGLVVPVHIQNVCKRC
jgi:hypothetical protein